MTPTPQAPWHIGVDIGGTFTDVVLADASGRLVTAKSPSRPDDPARGLIAALELLARRCEVDLGFILGNCALLVHGSTIATNILLERKGARVGLLTTEGFRDALEIRRGIRRNPWDHRTDYPPVLVPRYLRLPVRERIDRHGREFAALDRESVEQALTIFRREAVESVAICLLNSYLDPAHEGQVAEIVRAGLPGAWVSVSSAVASLAGEYERVSTTVVDAYVAPRLVTYLARLKQELAARGLARPLLLVKNNGGTASLDEIAREPVTLTLSGPAAAVGALRYFGAMCGSGDLISVEVGGTSCDVLLMAEGKVGITDKLSISDYDMLVPSVDIHTVGAGGGAIARVDASGVLSVGPEGAGARPGPACYGLGGEEATVTDAQLVLGRLRPGPHARGVLSLDLPLAARAIGERIARPLGLELERAAAGIIRIAEQRMLHAVSFVSVQRGLDPRRFTLVSGGGAGALHAATIGRMLGCRRVHVPRQAGVFCAIGMINTDVRHDFVVSRLAPLETRELPAIAEEFRRLEKRARAVLEREGFGGAEEVRIERELDLRYRAQQWDVRVRLEAGGLDAAAIRAGFEAEYERLFGHRQPEAPVEAVKLRLAGFGRLPPLAAVRRPAPSALARPPERRAVFLAEANSMREVPIYGSDDLRPGEAIEGPLLIEEETTTILVGPGDRLRVDDFGNYLIELRHPGAVA